MAVLGIEPGHPATLVRNFTTELPRPISTIHIIPSVIIISLFAIFLICVTLCKEIKFSLRRKSKQVECQNNKVNVKTILVQIVTYWMM